MPRWESPEANFRWRFESLVDQWNREMVTQGIDGPLYERSEKKGVFTITPMSKAAATRWEESYWMPSEPGPEPERELEAEEAPEPEGEGLPADWLPDVMNSTDIDESVIGDAPTDAD